MLQNDFLVSLGRVEIEKKKGKGRRKVRKLLLWNLRGIWQENHDCHGLFVENPEDEMNDIFHNMTYLIHLLLYQKGVSIRKKQIYSWWDFFVCLFYLCMYFICK